jgi:4-amino-4-deoxy-L-arabinose transferase-like glycosyltransferase
MYHRGVNDVRKQKAAGSVAWECAGLLGLALVYRLVFLWAMPRVLDTADAIHYIETAAFLHGGDFFGYDPKIPVLYPLLGALVHFFVSDLEWACRWVSFAASVLIVLPVYGLARDMHGPRAARWAGIIVALWPWLADYGCRVSTEAVACLWWILGVWCLSRAIRRGGWWLVCAPLCFYALTLTRAEGLFIWLASGPALLVLTGGALRRHRKALLIFGGASAALIMANMIYLRLLTGVSTANYRVHFIVSEFDYFRFAHTALSTVNDVFPVMLGPVLFLFLGVGFFQGSEKRRRDLGLELYVLVFVATQWAASLFVLSPAPRYLMAPLICLALWSASGMALVSAAAARMRYGAVLRALPGVALVTFMVAGAAVTVASEHLGRLPREPREYKMAGQWMAENLEPGLVFTRKPQVGYYAGMPSTGPMLEDSLAEALARAHATGARYMVVDERYAPGALRPLLEPENAPEELRLLHDIEPFSGGRVVIYGLGGE